MWNNENIVSEKKLNCSGGDCPPDSSETQGEGVQGAVNVNVIFDSGNTFSRSASAYHPYYSTQDTEAPVVQPHVVQPNVIPPIQPVVVNPSIIQPAMVQPAIFENQYSTEITNQGGQVPSAEIPSNTYQSSGNQNVPSIIPDIWGERVNQLLNSPPQQPREACVQSFYPEFL